MKTLFYVTAIILGLRCCFLPLGDPDLGWQLLGGWWTVTNGTPPIQDFININNNYWIDYHWLAQIPMYLAYANGGFIGLQIIFGLWMVVFRLVLARYIAKLTKNNWGAATMLLILSDYLIYSVTSIRPQIIFLPFLLLAMMTITAKWRFEAILLFAFAVLGANMHVYWVFIPVFWFLYRCVPRILGNERFSSLYCWGVLFALSLAGLISPYGIFASFEHTANPWLPYMVILDYLRMSKELQNAIVELSSPFISFDGVTVILLCYLVFISRTTNIKLFRKEAGIFSTATLLPLLTIKASKYIGIFAIAILPYLAKYLRHAKLHNILIIVLVGSYLVHQAYDIDLELASVATLEETRAFEACKAIARHSKHKATVVVTHFNYGGWCRFAAWQENPSQQFYVTTDGRTQGVPDEYFIRMFKMFGAKEGFLKELGDLKGHYLLGNREASLTHVVDLAPETFKTIYRDTNFAAYEIGKL